MMRGNIPFKRCKVTHGRTAARPRALSALNCPAAGISHGTHRKSLHLPASIAAPLAVALLLVTLGGCTPYPQSEAMADSYYLNPRKDLRDLGRVALVELDNASDYPDISRDATRALFLELQKKQIFGMASVSRDDPVWPTLQQSFDSLHTVQALGAMRENLRSNGLLLGTVTEYRPYPRMSIGLRIKLIDLTDGQLLWGVEQVWDSTDLNVQRRIRAYAHSRLRYATGPTPEELVTLSSLEFLKFAACEVAQTLDMEAK
jgi:hypothetical protein